MSLSTLEATFLGTVLEGCFYGVYCIVFSLYLRVQKRAGRNNVNYPITALFILCTVFFPLDFTQQFITIFRGGPQQTAPWTLNLVASTIYSLVDFISQSVLIYRCWIMWGRQILVIVLPSLLALTSLATSLILVAELSLFRTHPEDLPVWFFPMGTASFSLSLAVNTTVTGLLVLKLILVHQEVTHSTSVSSIRRGYDLLPVISVLIESGMFTFISQLIWVVLFKLQNSGFNAVGGPITMIYGITPTIIIVRVAMGSSTYVNQTKAESTMRFMANDQQGRGTTTLTSIDQRTTGRTRVHNKSTDHLELEKLEEGIQ